MDNRMKALERIKILNNEIHRINSQIASKIKNNGEITKETEKEIADANIRVSELYIEMGLEYCKAFNTEIPGWLTEGEKEVGALKKAR